MNKSIIILALIFFGLSDLVSQKERLPYLSNGKYGVVDESGKMIISPDYDNVVIHPKHNLICLLKDDLWAVFSLEGQQILDHILKNDRSYGERGPNIIGVRADQISAKPTTNLVSIKDSYANVAYYINPNAINKSYKAYRYSNKRSKKPKNSNQSSIHNNFIVTNRDDSCAAIDSTGAEIHSNTFQEAYVINDVFTAIGKNGLFALYQNKERITYYKYTSFTQLPAEKLFYGTFKKTIDGGSSKKRVHLFDAEGNIFLEASSIKSRLNFIVVRSDNNERTLYDAELNKIMSFKNRPFDLLRLGSKHYIKSSGHQDKNTQNSKKKSRAKFKGLYDSKGSLVLDTIYSSIEVKNDLIHCSTENSHAVLDSNLNTIIESDTVSLLESTVREGIFKFAGAGSKYNPRLGLMDINQKPIVPAKYKEIIVFPCQDLVQMTIDSTTIIKRLSDDKIISQGKDVLYYSDCKGETINMRSKSKTITMDFDGNILNSFYHSREHQKYQVKRIANTYTLVDNEGNAVDDYPYEQIEVCTDPDTQKSAYFFVYRENKEKRCKVLNEDLEEIIPPGYDISPEWIGLMKMNKGTVYVANRDDILALNYHFRSGVIDYDGNWIVKPFLSIISTLVENLFVAINYEIEKFEFYNKDGKKINTRDYDILGGESDQYFFQNRAIVGVAQNNAKPIERGSRKKDFGGNLNHAMVTNLRYFEAYKREGDPDILYGFVNKQGKEIIPPKYISAENFGEKNPYATVMERDKNGKISSHIIDTLDNKILSVPYESLSKLYDGYYKCKSDGLYGIIDSTGTAKTPFKFKWLNLKLHNNKICVGSVDGQNYLIDQNFNIIQLDPSDDLEIKSINRKYFFAKLKFKIPDSYKFNNKCLIYTHDLKHVGTADNVQEISDSFNQSKLPEDYLAITRKDKSKVVLNLKENKFLEQK